jgi:hypothetical protein
MNNKITANVEFYFKGVAFTPSAELDLDKIMQQKGAIPALHQYLATLNNIDTYSYEYEIMLTEDIRFNNAQGNASQFLHGNKFDHDAFQQHWHEQNLLQQLAPILKQQLDIDDIETEPALKSVLLTTYHLAKNS